MVFFRSWLGIAGGIHVKSLVWLHSGILWGCSLGLVEPEVKACWQQAGSCWLIVCVHSIQLLWLNDRKQLRKNVIC